MFECHLHASKFSSTFMNSPMPISVLIEIKTFLETFENVLLFEPMKLFLILNCSNLYYT